MSQCQKKMRRIENIYRLNVSTESYKSILKIFAMVTLNLIRLLYQNTFKEFHHNETFAFYVLSIVVNVYIYKNTLTSRYIESF